MKKLAAVIAIVIIATVASAGCLTVGSSSGGFDMDDLTAPEIVYADAVNIAMPEPMMAVSPQTGMDLSWSVTEDIYAGSGGALLLTIENINSIGRLYVYGFGLVWDDGTSTYRNCSVYVPAGEARSLGLLVFDAPADPGVHSYTIKVKAAASVMMWDPVRGSSEAWRDQGEMSMSKARSADVVPLNEMTEQAVKNNIPTYYSKINSLVSYEAAEGMADAVRTERPGNYSILQVVEAFEQVRAAIDYKDDGNVDHWQDAAETLELGTGDCEDHAILMASVIGALGGNARVNIVQGHAFPTVFVGTTEQQMAQVENAIASYYGLAPGELTAAHLVDEAGYWLVVDTTGFPYAGGIPAQSGYTSADGDWSIRSDYLYAIDATGDASTGLFGF